MNISKYIANNLSEVNIASSQPKKTASVIIPLCNRNGVASIIFTQRTEDVGTHKGQVSFPGGHIDSGETAVDAAVREAYEELGKDIGEIEVLGVCQTIPAITGTLVTPVIGFLKRDIAEFEHFSPSTYEVKQVFSHPIERLLDPSFRDEQEFQRNGRKIKMPVFDPSHPELRIWGLTAMILDAILKNAISPTLPEEGIPRL